MELSMRDPTLPIGALVAVWPGAEGRAAFAGCDASARQSTTIAVKPPLITRIYAHLPAGSSSTTGPIEGAIAMSAGSNPDGWPVKCRPTRLMASRHVVVPPET